MTNEENASAPEASEFEKTLAAMTPEQLNRVTGIVAGENAKRADPLARLGSMSDAEARRAIDEKFGFMPF